MKERNEWTIFEKGIILNHDLKLLVANMVVMAPKYTIYIAIEKMVNYNQKVGASTFDTIEYIGRFKECWEECAFWLEIESMPRKTAVGHLCNFTTDGDKHVRAALIKRFGDIGTKAEPGVLYGFSSHLWSALAIAVTYIDKSNLGAQSDCLYIVETMINESKRRKRL